MKDIVEDKNSNTIVNYISFFAIIFTVLSFHPSSVMHSFFGRIYTILWLLVIAFSILKKQIKFNKLFIGMVVSYAVCNISTFLANFFGIYETKSSIGVGMYLGYCIEFYFIGYNGSDSKDFGEYAIKAFSYGAFLVILITLSLGINPIQKNQTGQIFGAFNIAISTHLLILRTEKKRKYLYFPILILTLYMLIINGARTSVIAILVVYTIMLLKTNIFTKNKKTLFVVVWIAAIFFLRNNTTINELFGGYVKNQGRMSASEVLKYLNFKEALDVITSGRITVFERAIAWFLSSPVFGVGAWAYVDNFFIHTLCSGGLIYALSLFPITYGTMFSTYKSIDKIDFSDKKDKRIAEIVRYLVVFYFVESLMEGYPPLGPGASSFFLWLLLGFYNGRRDEFIAQKSIDEGDTDDFNNCTCI